MSRSHKKSAVKIRSVKFNVVMNMILTSSSLIFPLITIPYASRILSTQGMGAVAFTQSVASYFSLVAMLGIQNYGVRVCAEVRDDRVELSKRVKELLMILLCTTLSVSIIYIVCIWLVPQMAAQKALFLEFTVFIWLTSFGVEWFYQALEQYGYITVRNVLFKCVALIVMFLTVKQSNDYVIYGGVVILAGGASNIVNLLRLRVLIDFSLKQKLDIKRHLKPMKWFTIAAVSSGMYTQVDIVLLGFLGTTHMVGLYQLVTKIKAVLISCVNAVGGVLLPRFTYYSKRNQSDKADALMAKTLNFIMVLGLGIIVLLIIAAKQIVLIMGGAAFAQSALPLMCVGPAVLFSAMNIILANHMMAAHQERAWAIINAVGLVVAIFINAVLISTTGAMGAAISISVCECIVFVMRCFACKQLLGRIRRDLDPVKIVVSAAVAFGGSIGVHVLLRSSSLWGTFAEVIAFGLIYLCCLCLCRERFVYFIIRSMWCRHGRSNS